MKVETLFGFLLMIACAIHCQSRSLIVDVVELSSIDSYTFVCYVPSSTNLTRWTYLSGSTGTSLMSYQNGRCTVSPSDSFLNDSRRYTYTCNNTVHQVTLINDRRVSIHNRILSCKDAYQIDSTGSTWIIKIKPDKADNPFIHDDKEYRVIENTPGTLACTVKGGNPSPTLTWKCNNVSLTNQSTVNSNRTITTLVWTPSRNHTGTCACTSIQTGFQDSTVGVTLVVLYEASITSFLIEGYTRETVTVNEGDPVRFVCNADSYPTATMTLSHDSKTLNTKTTNTLEYNIIKANCLDAGLYVCNAYNRASTPFDVLQLLVKCYPRPAKYVDRNLKTDIGTSITIVFDVIAYPSPTYKWYQLENGTWTLLTENDKYRMSSSAVQSNLTIHSVSTNDFTSYKVISTNEIGNMEQEFGLSPYGIDSSDSFTFPGPLIGGIIGGTIGIVVLVALGIIVLRRHGYLNACSTIRKTQDNTINSPVEESAYNNIGCVPEYEMINQGNRESIPYSSLEQTQQSQTSDNQNERKKDVYENLKV